MGFGTVMAQCIIFISVMTIAVTLTYTMTSQMSALSSSMSDANRKNMDRLRTDLSITDVSYNSSTKNIAILLKNTGKTIIDIERMDLVLDGERLPASEYTATIPSDGDVLNPGLWDPRETAIFEVVRTLSDGSHTVKLITGNAVSDSYLFSTG